MADTTLKTEPRPRYRCEYCKNDDASVFADGDLMVCTFCDDVCSRRFICDVCEEHDCANGAEQCLECIADQCVEDPRELDSCSKELQAEVARVLAKRLKPFLRQRQAA
jgi:hypothetical protein